MDVAIAFSPTKMVHHLRFLGVRQLKKEALKTV